MLLCTSSYLAVHGRLPVCLIGGDEAGDIAQDAATTLDDGEGVRVAAVCQCSHQKCQSTIH